MFVKNKATLFLVIVFVLAGCAPTPHGPQVQDIQVIEAKERIISAQGVGEVRVRPDAVRFTITVKTDGSELTTALEDNEKATQEALALLKKYEIADADIETSQPSQEEGIFEPVHYIVRQNISVVLRDLTKYEPLFTEILRSKAYQTSEVHFLISDLTPYKEQVLNLAVSDARNKAEIMATEIGRELGEVLTVYEESLYGYENGINWRSSNLEVTVSDPTSQSFNELQIQVWVKLEFQLK